MSPRAGPTICNPIGSPAAVIQQEIDAAGYRRPPASPVRLQRGDRHRWRDEQIILLMKLSHGLVQSGAACVGGEIIGD
jgi:hypothetical protein